ncbi:membrane-associated protein, putative [Bodo saltans]|uniref:Membrane-associated protein, putative n=1 Tax=Bodo saltans TaxID=75058 RepID=A0A0S4JSH8_BODSA|nr:membrane-associated protein, putative [Bodo saltans]|eukprot:CUG91491.1 membrane-associated protein, putative [Bodo saltans]
MQKCTATVASLVAILLVCQFTVASVLDTGVGEDALDAQISHSYYFESHGRDDIREWRAAILKGGQYLKIDLNFISDESLCRQQQELPAGYNYSMGCFVLVHSFDNVTFWGQPAHTFNTTQNIADWLLDDRNLDVLLLRPIIFQMCLKGKPNLCDGSPAAAQWTALIDAFYTLVQPIVSNASRINNNVQFVFDQLNQADQCILERWRPWNSTWVGEAGTGEDSNNGGNATFQMVNMDLLTASWQHLNNTNWGKFNDGWYAMVAWEPVTQLDCNSFLAYFRTFRYVNPAGVILAYNSDPSMFHVLTASETDRYSHFPFGPEQSLTPVVWFSEEHNKLFTVSLLSTDSAILVLTIHNRQPRGKFSIIATVPIRLAAGDATSLFGGAIASLDGALPNASSVTLLVSGANGVLCPITIAFTQESFTVDSTAAFITTFSPPSGSPISIGFTASDGGNNARLVVTAVVNQTTQLLTANLYEWILTNEVVRLSNVWSGVLATNVVADEGISSAITWDSNWVGIVVTWATNRSVYTAAAQGTYNSSTQVFSLTAIQPLPGSNFPHVKVGVGRTPSIVFASSASGQNDVGPAAKLLLTYGWSFCYNDQFVDDDVITMVAVKICDLRDASYFELNENPVNSYVFTSFFSYFNEVAQYANIDSGAAYNQHRNGFATSCGDAVFHGVFDVGFNATAVLVPKSVENDVDIDNGGYLAISAMTSLTLPTLSQCGEPQLYNGRAILDTFPLFGFYNRSAI